MAALCGFSEQPYMDNLTQAAAVTTSHQVVAVHPLAKTVESFRAGVAQHDREEAEFHTKQRQRTYQMIARACEITWPYIYGDKAAQVALDELYHAAQINIPKAGENPCHAACLLLWGRFDPEQTVQHDGVTKQKFIVNPSANKYAHAMRLAHKRGIDASKVAEWIESYSGKLHGIIADDQKEHPYRTEGDEDEKVKEHIRARVNTMPDLGSAKAEVRAEAARAKLQDERFARAVLAKGHDGEWGIVALVPGSADAARGDLERISRAELRERQKLDAEKKKLADRLEKQRKKAVKAREAEAKKQAQLAELEAQLATR